MDQNAIQIDDVLKFEAAVESDFAALFSWFDTAHALKQWGGPALSLQRSYHDLMAQLHQSPDYTSYAIHQGQQTIAFGQLLLLKDRAHLARLCVKPARRGEKIGLRLVNELIQQAAQSIRLKSASLFVYESNYVAIACYQKLGFVEAPTPAGITKPEQCKYMMKRC
jgi:ribosomal protein S18 acetylase RimI-like enzyme